MPNSNLSKNVAAEVRAELARQQKTLSELSDAVEIPLSTLRRSVKGQRSFTIDELASVATWLGCDLLEFVKKTDHAAA